MALKRWREWAMDQEQLRRLHLIERVPLFAGLSRRHLGKLLVRLFEKRYASGEAIFLEGEPGRALFIVLEGGVSIARAVDGGEQQLAVIAPGGYFGELALIDDLPRAASARAADDSVLLILYKSHFDELIEGSSAIAVRVMSNLLKTLAGYVRAGQPRSSPTAATPASAPQELAATGVPLEGGSR
jgi:CRP/FNR family cyclic AMP-dependent transcriptional regulator